jgi:hypothetical protein
LRALSDLMVRVGGPSNMSLDELAVMIATAPVDATGAALQQEVEALREQLAAANQMAARVAALEKQLADLSKLASVHGSPAGVAALAKRVDELANLVNSTGPAPVDWEHPGKLGQAKANSAKVTTLAASGQITSTVADGTAPMVVTSKTKVTNLNADTLDGTDWAAPGTIGGTTPASANFTTVNASGQVSAAGTVSTRPYSNVSDLQLVAAGNIAGVNLRATGSGRLSMVANYQAANTTSIQVGTADNAPNTEAVRIDHATGGVRLQAGFGCNGKAPQTAAASGGTLAGVISALVANGILSS